MARQLWLLRHAEAEPHGVRADAERRLTERGERQAYVAGAAIARLATDFDAILVSPKLRAAQTAELAAAQWSPQLRSKLQPHQALAGGFDASQALHELAGIPADGRLLLVGHEPDLSAVVGDLTGALVDLKKGGLAVLRLQSVGGELIILARPRELALIAGSLDADV